MGSEQSEDCAYGSESGGVGAAYGPVGRALIDCYFGKQKGHQLVKHQLDSYNDFVSNKLEQIIEGFNPIDMSHQFLPEHACYRYLLSLRIVKPVLSKPTIFEKDGTTKVMMPNDARLRKLTYAAPLHVDVEIKARTFSPETGEYTVEAKRIASVGLGRLPVMVRSRYCMLQHQQVPSGMDECVYDYGGYFIINGNEKVVVSQDRIAENRTYVFVNSKATSYSHIAEIRSVQEARFGVPKTTTLKLTSKANQFGRSIHVVMHHVRHDLPLFVLFRALGVESDRAILRHIVPDENAPDAELITRELAGCIDEASEIRTTDQVRVRRRAAHHAVARHACARSARLRKARTNCMARGATRTQAIEYIVRFMHTPSAQQQQLQQLQLQQQGPAAVAAAALNPRAASLKSVLRKDFLPHVGLEPAKKALYLGYMVYKLLRCFLGLQPFDDRDSYINQRLETPGVLLANLFRQHYGKVVKDLRTLLQKDMNTGAWRATGKFINVLTTANVYKVGVALGVAPPTTRRGAGAGELCLTPCRDARPKQVIKPTVIESGLKYGLATGNWGVKTSRMRQGVAQVGVAPGVASLIVASL